MEKAIKARRGLMVGAAMGDCVHVAGVLNFLRLAAEHGFETFFMGAAKSPEEMAAVAKERGASALAAGYRLDPVAGGHLFGRLRIALDGAGIAPTLMFGGTPPVAEVARSTGMFDAVFSGKEDVDEVIAYLRGRNLKGRGRSAAVYPDTLVERIRSKEPYPIIRHHFGLPSVRDTAEGIERIAGSGVLDVLSLGPDQNFQEHFFRPEGMDRDQDGSGGVPIRSEADLRLLWESSRRGNYPLMRCYSGTQDAIRMAALLRDTIHNAWGAIPLFWYNVLDGRGPRPVERSIAESLEAIAWHADRGIPVEVNESHHWSLRDAPDVVAVAAAFLAAYNAKKVGVRNYVSQYMLNTPPGTTAAMDLGKMLAKDELIGALADDDFTVFRQIRAGLSSFPTDLSLAKGQLATSTLVGMNLRPHIVHVVGFCEGDHVANPEDVIESARIARGVIRNCLQGMPDMTRDPAVQSRKRELMRDAGTLLSGLVEIGSFVRAKAGSEFDGDPFDPYADPVTLALAVRSGLFDAPHLTGNPAAWGGVETSIVGGACVAVDPVTRKPLKEALRVETAVERARGAARRSIA